MKKNQSGFGHSGIVLAIVVLVAVGLVGFEVYNNQHNTNRTAQNTEPVSSSNVSIGVKDYRNSELGLTFSYPKNWTVNKINSESKSQGEVADLVSPKNLAAYKNFDNSSGFRDSPPSSSLLVYHWKDINNENTLGGSWEGMKASYKNLDDFMTDPGPQKKILGTETINGQKVYKFEEYGESVNYGIMFERSNGVYKFGFYNDAYESGFTKDIDNIIKSIKFQ